MGRKQHGQGGNANNQKNQKKTKQQAKKPLILAKDAHKIKTYKSFKNLGIVLFDDETMQQIKNQSGPLADKCEYQTHYWAFVARFMAPDDTVVDIAIPTVYFNYKQEVNGAHIDFELEEVDEISNALEPAHNAKVNELYEIEPEIEKKLKAMFPEDWEMTLSNVNLNTIHKHPGSAYNQSFSGTDLCTNHEAETGVVFPLAEAKDKPNFAGIMAHENGSYLKDGKNKVAHFEYRVANGKVGPGEDDVIDYVRGRCFAYIREIKEVSEVESFLGIDQKVEGYEKADELDADLRKAKIFADIKALWHDLADFKQDTEWVKEENVFEKKVPVRTVAKTTTNSTKAKNTPAKQECSVGLLQNSSVKTNLPTKEEATELLKEFKDITFIVDSYVAAITKPKLIEKLTEIYTTYYGEPVKEGFFDGETLVALRNEYKIMKIAITEEIEMLEQMLLNMEADELIEKENEEKIAKEEEIQGEIDSEEKEISDNSIYHSKEYPKFDGKLYGDVIEGMKLEMIQCNASLEELDAASDATIEVWYANFANQG